MFDTTKLKADEVDLSLRPERGWREITTDDGGVPRPMFLLRRKGSPSINYSPRSGRISVGVSLPKLLYGQNVSLLAPSDVPAALDGLSNRITDAVQAPIPWCGDWTIQGRSDVAYSWQAGALVPEYLDAFSQIALPYHWLDRAGSSVYWKNDRRWVRFYDKFRESGIPEASGILRFEIQMNRAREELGDRGMKSDKASDLINWPTARAVLDRYLGKLGVDDLKIDDEDQTFSKLVKAFGLAKGTRLHGYLVAKRRYGRDGLLSRGHNRATDTEWMRRNAADLKKAGISIAVTAGEALPPLILPGDEYNGESGSIGNK